MKIETVTGRMVVVRGADIDTDRIMPARFLKVISFEGLEAHLFADDRVEARGQGGVHPFDRPDAAGASILIAGPNFGCGSSREHAPQALRRWGIGAIVAASFAEIFAGNATAIGLVCATVSAEDLDALMAHAERDPPLQVTVDLAQLVVRSGPEWQMSIGMPSATRHALTSGEWDATELLLADYDEVSRVEARLPYLRATSRNA